MDRGARRDEARATLDRFASSASAVPDNARYLAITRANGACAQATVDAWRAADLIGDPETIHGEWFFGPPSSQPTSVDTTGGIGFVDGAGDISRGRIIEGRAFCFRILRRGGHTS